MIKRYSEFISESNKNNPDMVAKDIHRIVINNSRNTLGISAAIGELIQSGVTKETILKAIEAKKDGRFIVYPYIQDDIREMLAKIKT